MRTTVASDDDTTAEAGSPFVQITSAGHATIDLTDVATVLELLDDAR